MNQKEEAAAADHQYPPLSPSFSLSKIEERKTQFHCLFVCERGRRGNGGEEIRSSAVRRGLRVREEEVRRVLWGVRENAGGRRREMGRLQSCTWAVSR